MTGPISGSISGLVVAGSLTGPLTGPVSFPYADAPRLALMFGGDKEFTIGIIVDRADLVLAKKCPHSPRCTIWVLRAMLSCLGEHSNRIWPSQEHIQLWLQDELGIDVSLETIGRAQRDIKFALGIGPIKDRATVLMGPGSHQYPEEDRRVKEGIVPTWEMTPVYDLIPKSALHLDRLYRIERLLLPTTSSDSLLAAILSAASSNASLAALLSAELKAMGSSMVSSMVSSMASLSSIETWTTYQSQSPYDPPPEPERPERLPPLDSLDPACNVGKEKTARRSPTGQNGPKGRKFDPSNLTGKTDYSKAVEKQAGNQAGVLTKPSKRQMASEVAATMPGVAQLMAAVPGLQPRNALRWIQAEGLPWCLNELVPYGEWQASRIDIRNRGGYLNNTLDGWIAERVETGQTPVWPDRFVDYLKQRAKRTAWLSSLPPLRRAGDLTGLRERAVEIDEAGEADEGALPVVRAMTAMEAYVAVRPQRVVKRPPALDAAWKAFLAQAGHSVPMTVIKRCVTGLVPIAWDAVTRQATLYCAFSSSLRTLQTHQNALSEALQAALGLSGLPSVRIHFVDEIDESAGDGSPPS